MGVSGSFVVNGVSLPHTDVSKFLWAVCSHGFIGLMFCALVAPLLLSRTDIPFSQAAVFLAQLMGIYITSSTVLARPFLPPGSRALIAELQRGGHVEYEFFSRYFDAIFLSSAAIAAFVLLRPSPATRLTPAEPPKSLAAPGAWGGDSKWRRAVSTVQVGLDAASSRLVRVLPSWARRRWRKLQRRRGPELNTHGA